MKHSLTCENVFTDLRGKLEDRVELKIGQLIGHGTTREVYSVIGYPDIVIKKNITHYPANFLELKLWQASIGLNIRDNLAPIYDYTDDFKYIVMARCDTSEELNVKGTNFLKESDVNLAILNGKIVAIDYAPEVVFNFRTTTPQTLVDLMYGPLLDTSTVLDIIEKENIDTGTLLTNEEQINDTQPSFEKALTNFIYTKHI